MTNEATSDPAQVAEWWTRWPEANIGIACGPSGILVLDPDLPKQSKDGKSWSANGREAWQRLATEQGWPTEPDVVTGSGGWHIYCQNPDGLGNRPGGLPAGIDVRGAGGYVVAPGSIVDGRSYEGALLAVRDLPAIPASLVAILGGQVTETSTGEVLDASTGDGGSLTQLLLTPPTEGGRNIWLSRVAGHLAALFPSDHSTYLVLCEQANRSLQSSLDHEEFDKTVKSIWSTEQAKRTKIDHAVETGQLDRTEVNKRVLWMLTQAEAKREVRRLTEPPVVEPPILSLRDVLAQPEEPPHRVAGLIPHNAFTLLVGQAKAGKTVFGLNLVYSLLTGEPFLGVFPVQPVEGNIAYLNFEVSNRTLANWAHDLGIDQERFFLIGLRGLGNPLDDPETRSQLAARLRALNIETLVIDPLSQAFTGDENSTAEVGTFLRDLVRFALEDVGAQDLILIAHAGHNGERVRGNSRLLGDPDAIITLTYDEAGEKRFMKAIGRDVNVYEDLLEFDERTRRLSKTGAGSRLAVKKQAAVEGKSKLIEDLATHAARLIRQQPGLSKGRFIEALRADPATPGFQDKQGYEAIACAVERKWITTTEAKSGVAQRHYPADTPADPCRTPAEPLPGRGPQPPLPPSLYGAAGVVVRGSSHSDVSDPAGVTGSQTEGEGR